MLTRRRSRRAEVLTSGGVSLSVLKCNHSRLFETLDGCESLWFQAVEFFDEGAGHGVAEACVEVDLSEPVHPGLVQVVRRPAGVLFRGLLGSRTIPISSRAVVIFLYLLYTGVGDFDRTDDQSLAAAIGDELPGVEEDQVGPSDEQPYDDARRVETRHAAHEGSCGRGHGVPRLSEPLCHEPEDLAALEVAAALYCQGVESKLRVDQVDQPYPGK